MSLEIITRYFIASVVVICLVYDLVVILRAKSTKPSITHQTIELSKKYPIIPFLWGFLMGHFYG